jgi:hypothetical protein
VKTLLCRTGLAVLLGCALLSSGCATITGSESQSILSATHDDSGDAVAGADCKFSNNNGSWTAKSPATVTVRKSAEDLIVRCELEERSPGTARVVSKMNAGMVGNVVFGGAVGAIIDHSRGTAYDYPTRVRIVFGMNRVVEGDDVVSSIAPVSAAAPPPTPRPPGRTTMNDLDGLLQGK